MSWQTELKGDPLPWLLEDENPAVSHLAVRDLLDLPAGSAEQIEARRAAHAAGPIAAVLDKMNPAGWWVKPGPGYNPRYRSTDWSIISLAQMGASAAADERVARGCAYTLDHALAAGGKFTYNGAPSGTVDCLQGNLCWALTRMGYEDSRLDLAFDWMARTVTGEGLASPESCDTEERYYAAKYGPDFACGYNVRKPCAWGAAKVMLAFGSLPAEKRTPLIQRAIQRGVDFLFSVDPATAAYPTRHNDKPSRNWWEFTFPVFYNTDLLQIVEALTALGYGQDPRLANALNLVRDKQDLDGRWALEHHYTVKSWFEFGETDKPNKWVTLRALRVLKAILF
ncbi:MAG: nitrogen fixation protein NifH [Anaerolineaceae bacterium]